MRDGAPRRVQAFCRRQNPDAGRIQSARADKKEGPPAGVGPLGIRTHWEGLENTMALCLLYLEAE
ncbi:hypothetical protein [Pseudoflavonifractor intestinihominis]|uniref:Uncharacterized protein n=1 Tax=Pseudoflavonifractor intestinihominis TaxID=3133171 RepID=A0ABV1EB68_9FIRM|nr:hypothetical protein [uncultured Pseudoflavonifractor sp.]